MSVRRLAILSLLPVLAAPAFAATAPRAAAPAPAARSAAPAGASQTQAAPPPGGAAPAAPTQFSVNQPYGDWAVRCALTTVQSPAPCDVIQVTVNQDTKQRVMSLSFAYVPSRSAYAMQAIVPSGVALQRGMTLALGNVGLHNIHFNRCERDGCYVENLVDEATVTGLKNSGAKTTVTVTAYGQTADVALPVSLNGFSDALTRMKELSTMRATQIPANTPIPGILSPTANPPPAPAGAAPAAGAAAKPAPAPAKP